MHEKQVNVLDSKSEYLYDVEKTNLPTSIIIIMDEIKIIVSLWNTIPSSPYLSCPCFPSKFSLSRSNSRCSSLRLEFLAKLILCKTLRLVAPRIDLLFILYVINVSNNLSRIVRMSNKTKKIYFCNLMFSLEASFSLLST